MILSPLRLPVPPPPLSNLQTITVSGACFGACSRLSFALVLDTERQLANQLGYMQAEQLHSLIRQHPIFAPVADHPRMATFIKEFLSYFHEDEPGEPIQEKAEKKAA